jgi:hypothetical protein
MGPGPAALKAMDKSAVLVWIAPGLYGERDAKDFDGRGFGVGAQRVCAGAAERARFNRGHTR